MTAAFRPLATIFDQKGQTREKIPHPSPCTFFERKRQTPNHTFLLLPILLFTCALVQDAERSCLKGRRPPPHLRRNNTISKTAIKKKATAEGHHVAVPSFWQDRADSKPRFLLICILRKMMTWLSTSFPLPSLYFPVKWIRLLKTPPHTCYIVWRERTKC